MENLILKTEKELKVLVNDNRKEITNINGVEFTSNYPILTVSNTYASYYDVATQSNIYLNAPFNINF